MLYQHFSNLSETDKSNYSFFSALSSFSNLMLRSIQNVITNVNNNTFSKTVQFNPIIGETFILISQILLNSELHTFDSYTRNNYIKFLKFTSKTFSEFLIQNDSILEFIEPFITSLDYSLIKTSAYLLSN